MKLVSDQMRSFFDYAFGDNKTPLNPVPNPDQPRPLTEADRTGWELAMDERAAASCTPTDIDSIRRLIRHRNIVRWHSLQKDFKWVQKEMKKMGLNPDDARYIL